MSIGQIKISVPEESLKHIEEYARWQLRMPSGKEWERVISHIPNAVIGDMDWHRPALMAEGPCRQACCLLNHIGA